MKRSKLISAAIWTLVGIVTLFIARGLWQKGALVNASSAGNVTAINLHLCLGADPNTRDELTNPVLLLAIQGGHADAAATLIRAGADPNAPDRFGTTPLLAALNQTSSKPLFQEIAVKLIAKGADVRARGKSATAVTVALHTPDISMLKLVLDKGGDPNPAYLGAQIPLSIAVGIRSLERTKLLLDRGANPNYLGEPRLQTSRSIVMTPLISAAYSGQTDYVELLLERGAAPNQRMSDGESALDVVEREMKWESHRTVPKGQRDPWAGIQRDLPGVVRVLLKHGAKRTTRIGK